MNRPLVSVLIPMFNHAQYVKRCLDSLVEDGWDNLEVLVMDDGSSDNSFEVAKAWRDAHPSSFVRFDLNRQENQGIPRTLNRLVSSARGEYIVILASDDYLLEGGIAARVKALEENPAWSAVIGDTFIVDPSGQILDTSGAIGFAKRPPWVFDRPQTLRRELLLRWWSPGPSIMLRRRAYTTSQVGPYDETFSIEDRDYYLRLIAQDGLGFVRYPVSAYRVNPTRLAAPPPEHILRDEMRSEQKNITLFTPLEQFMLGIRSSRTAAKLELRREPGSLVGQMRLLLLNICWAFVRAYHQLYIYGAELLYPRKPT